MHHKLCDLFYILLYASCTGAIYKMSPHTMAQPRGGVITHQHSNIPNRNRPTHLSTRTILAIWKTGQPGTVAKAA